MTEDPAGALVRALETMLEISDQAAIDLAESRDESARVGQEFDERLKAKLEGVRTTPFALGDLEGKLERIREQYERTTRGEVARLDACESLMYLYAEESNRQSAATVFALLRKMRTIDIGEPMDRFTREMPRFPDASNFPPGVDPKREMLQSLTEHRAKMREYMNLRQKDADKKIAEQRELMMQALQVARSMI